MLSYDGFGNNFWVVHNNAADRIFFCSYSCVPELERKHDVDPVRLKEKY